MTNDIDDGIEDREDYGGLMGHVEIIHDPRDYEIVAAWEPGQCCLNCDCGKPHPTKGGIWCSITTQSKRKGAKVALNPKPLKHRCRSYIPNDPAKLIWIRVRRGLKVSMHTPEHGI